MAGCVSYTESEYKDSLAAKAEALREEIAETDRKCIESSGKLSPNCQREDVDADFAKRNADLKEYVQPAFGNTDWWKNNSDGFYGVMPRVEYSKPQLSERDKLVRVITTQQNIIRDLTDLLTK